MRFKFLGFLLAVTFCWAGSKVFADTKWQRRHPRREEVNGRLNNQNARIRNGVKTGKLTRQQAQQLRANDRSIRQQERADAAAHGGHITRAEKKQLNQEENANSKMIYDEKHPANP